MSTRQKSRMNSNRSVRSVGIQGPMSSRPSVCSSIVPPISTSSPRTTGNPNDLDIEITVANGSAWISRVSSNLAVKDADSSVSEEAVKASYTLSGATQQQLEINLVIPKSTAR